MATEIRGLEAINDHVSQLQRRLTNTNWIPLLRAISKVLEQRHGEYFQQGAGPDGKQWEQLKESTVKRKGHGVILIDKDDLEQTLTQSSHPDSIRDIYNEGDWAGLTFGTARKYSKFHQRGTKTLPVRLHVGVNQPIISEIATMTRDFAIGQLIFGD